MTTPVYRRLFTEAPPASQSDLPDSGIDSLYASFSKTEQMEISEGDGAFADPVNRAFGYRMLIDHLLNHELGNRLSSNGAFVPNGRLIAAREKYNQASNMGVWDPKGVTKDELARCHRHRDAVLEMLEQAETNIAQPADANGEENDVGNIDYEARYETPGDEDYDDTINPKDRADQFEEDYWRLRDIRLVKVKV